jgi:hypothetical protein
MTYKSTFERASSCHYRKNVAPLRENTGVLVTWFSNEVHFYLDGYMNLILGLKESYIIVCIMKSFNIRSRFQRQYSHFWRFLQSTEWWICPFQDGILHSNEFRLVWARLCQTSHQQRRTTPFHDSFEERALSNLCLAPFEVAFHGHQPHRT